MKFLQRSTADLPKQPYLISDIDKFVYNMDKLIYKEKSKQRAEVDEVVIMKMAGKIERLRVIRDEFKLLKKQL